MKKPDWWYPELTQTAEGLQLLSKALLGSLPTGLQQGKRMGPEQEFSQYRHYMPGDDLRQLDWKAYARSRRLYIKEAELTSGIQVWIIIDTSRSMRHQWAGWSKMAYARATAALLSQVALRQQDRPGLLMLNTEKVEILPFASQPRFFEQLLFRLAKAKSKAIWPPEPPAAIGSVKNALVLLLSDFHQEEKVLINWLSQLKAQGNEVVALQLIGKDEQNPFLLKSGTVLKDLESGEKRTLLQAKEAANQYFSDQARLFREEGVAHGQLFLGELPHQAIARYLASRKQR